MVPRETISGLSVEAGEVPGRREASGVGRMPAVRGGSVFRVAVLALLWGSGFLWTKLALRGFTPEQVVPAGWLGALVLLAVLRLVKQRLPQGRMTGST